MSIFKGEVKGKHLNLFWNIGSGTGVSIAVTLNKNTPFTGTGVNRFTEVKGNRFMGFAHLSSCYHKVTKSN